LKICQQNDGDHSTVVHLITLSATLIDIWWTTFKFRDICFSRQCSYVFLSSVVLSSYHWVPMPSSAALNSRYRLYRLIHPQVQDRMKILN